MNLKFFICVSNRRRGFHTSHRSAVRLRRYIERGNNRHLQGEGLDHEEPTSAEASGKMLHHKRNVQVLFPLLNCFFFLQDFKKNLSYKDNFDGEISAVSIYKSPEKVIDEDVCRVPLQHKESKDPSSVSGNNLIDGNSSVSSTKTETLSMSLEDYNDDDEEEEYRSPYESREPVLCQDMGDGDIVITYTGT